MRGVRAVAVFLLACVAPAVLAGADVAEVACFEIKTVLDEALVEISSLRSDLQAATARITALEHDVRFRAEHHDQEEEDDEGATGVATRRSRRLLAGPGETLARKTVITHSSVDTNFLNVSTLQITGALVWHGITVSFDSPTSIPTPAPTPFPSPEPTMTYTSCLAHLSQNPSAANGVYRITNDGTVYSAYCDMANGGWELAMRVQTPASEFLFASAYWTNAGTFGATSNMDPLANADAKWPSFMHSPFSKIRGCLQGVSSSSCKSYSVPGYSSLRNLFSSVPVSSSGLLFSESLSQMQEWLTIDGLSCADASTCNWGATGINVDDDTSCYNARVRFGLILNNELSMYTANDAVGFGAQDAGNCDSTGLSPAGVGAGLSRCCSTAVAAPGTIWVQ